MQEHRHPYHEHMLSDEIRQMLQTMILNQEQIMSTIQDVLEAVTKESGIVASVATLITQLEAQVKQTIPPGTLTADQQTAVDQIFATATANAAQLTTALGSTAANPAPVAVNPPPVAPTPPTTPPATPVAPAGASTPPASTTPGA